MSELRYNPLRGQWVATATARQERTFMPPADYCPLCPTKSRGFPTEIPADDYDIVVFENKFPSLARDPAEPAIEGDEFYRVKPSYGVCEVVVYSPDHGSTLADEPVEQIYKLILVWTDRYRSLGALDFVDYVFGFENKGAEVGVTLHHPHGQIYAYPFIPPVVANELTRCREHLEETGRCLICGIVDHEKRFERRVVAENDSFLAAVPFFAGYPYETHIYSKRHLNALTDFRRAERRDLAEILKQVLTAFDGLFDRPFPYIMSIHQRPTDGRDYSYYHFHIEFYPPIRSRDKLKFLAGSESGAGMFINDTLPEDKAAELRSHVTPVKWDP